MQLSNKEKKRFQQILKRYESGVATPEEIRFVEHYFDSLDLINKDADPFADMTPGASSQLKEKLRSKLWASISESSEADDQAGEKIRPLYKGLKRFAAAALILIALGTGLYFILNKTSNPDSTSQVVQNVLSAGLIQPGHSGAVLTLADGSTIVLDSASNQQVALQGGTAILNKDGQLQYKKGSAETAQKAVTMNTLTTPKARQYSLVLPDGTKVWLNASSSLTFPTAFAGGERKVTLKGEAYFEVVHDASRPFKVMAAGQEIKDIGTAFNVSAYADEPGMKATLVEGIIEVAGRRLRPGQAAIASENGQLTVKEVNIAEATAWKNGKFIFEKEDIQNVMRKLARWYDIEVQYHGALPQVTFTGSISRFDDINRILEKITYTSGIHFQIKERRIIVSQ